MALHIELEQVVSPDNTNLVHTIYRMSVRERRRVSFVAKLPHWSRAYNVVCTPDKVVVTRAVGRLRAGLVNAEAEFGPLEGLADDGQRIISAVQACERVASNRTGQFHGQWMELY